MNDRCEICMDPNCEVVGSCDCATCNRKDICYRELSPTIRITRKCTQSCKHCCFESSPEATEMMSVEMANNIHMFCKTNKISKLNVMGGEFFCNPDWFNIVRILGRDMRRVRLVSNGDWFRNEIVKGKLVMLCRNNKNIYLAISEDEWHTNRYISRCQRFMEENEISYVLENDEEASNNTILPVGNAYKNSVYSDIYGMFSAYCRNPVRRYSFLIVENGNIYACPLSERFYLGHVVDDINTFRSEYRNRRKPIIDNIISCGQCTRMHIFVNSKRRDK